MNNENHLPKIRSGFLEGALFLKSSHFNTRPKGEISLLVIHNISLPPKVFGGNFVEKFYLTYISLIPDKWQNTFCRENLV